MEHEKINKEPIFKRFVRSLTSRDFWVPRNVVDVIFILICLVLAWYAVTYDIPNAKVPVICATWWNKWAAEKANYLYGINASQDIATFVMKNLSIQNITIR